MQPPHNVSQSISTHIRSLAHCPVLFVQVKLALVGHRSFTSRYLSMFFSYNGRFEPPWGSYPMESQNDASYDVFDVVPIFVSFVIDSE